MYLAYKFNTIFLRSQHKEIINAYIELLDQKQIICFQMTNPDSVKCL